jgi:hypothetical protein
MSTAIILRGKAERPSLLDDIESLSSSVPGAFRASIARTADEQGRPLLVLAIHPAAEPVRVVDLGQCEVAIEANTGTAGPGYHEYITEFLRGMAEALGITWTSITDECGYFESRDRKALEEATLIWLRTTALEALALHARGMKGLQLSLPEGTVFEHDGIIATPMGPRDHAWLTKTAKDPRHGIDLFPWWESGQGAATLRGAALSAMWIDVRWRRPLVEGERELFERILGWLDRGQSAEPEAEWPWREQSELLEFLGEESLRATRVHLRASALPPAVPLGYRRNPVRVNLSGGWSMRIPGEFAERWEEPGAWVGWDANRSIWFSSVEVRGAQSSEAAMEALPPLEGEGELMASEHGELLSLARFAHGEEDGTPVIQLRAQSVFGSHAAIGTFILLREEDRDWALETWGTGAHIATH